MSFLKKLKSVADSLTGGGAKVTVEAINPSLREPFMLKVMAEIGENELKVNKVYLKVRGQLTVFVRGVWVARDFGGQIQKATEDVSSSEITFEQEFDLAGEQTLQPNQSYPWTTEVHLPPGLLPTYHSLIARHDWEISAGLDTGGNDPDSGWVMVEMV